MPNLHVFTGNRLEELADRLAAILERPLSSPLLPETLVVPNQGMGRWLSLHLAERFGVWANFRFLAPDELLSSAVRAVIPEAPDPAPFAPETLTWRIFKQLTSLAAAPEIRRYLADDPGGLKGFQLARKLSGTLELYGAFRPEMLAYWERGEDDDWQAHLWRTLAMEHPGAHKAAQLEALLARLPAASLVPGSLPERVAVFGLATLAPLRLRVLAALSALTEVNLFVVTPSQEYWGKLVSPREEARRRRAFSADRGDPEDLHLETGHPLLASLGRQGRDFLEELLELGESEVFQEERCFLDPGEGSLLACLQSDILNLRNRGGEGGPKTLLESGDLSLQIHSCHGPLRELEVLHDRLLDLFESLEGLTPGDILVAAPDIEVYAPYVEAVFDGCPDPARRIPFSVAGRATRSSSRCVDAFLRLLDLQGGRFGASAVLDLLEIPEVRRRFGLSDADLDTVHSWVEATRIRWGIDADARGRLGLPSYDQNTWRSGLRRLLLGYALVGEDRHSFGGILPFDDVEGGGARVLGAFADFTESLFAAMDELVAPRTLGQWATWLDNLVDRFLAADDAGEQELRALRRELSLLAKAERLAGVDVPVDLRVVRQHLGENLEEAPVAGGLFTGRVTFCPLRPLRSVPFRVVVLLGMNDGAFPRAARPPGFDRMAADPRRSDPSLRDEDRYLFLEALLSARERLYVSYIGQSVKDNSEAPPSVLVSELLDAVEQGFQVPEGDIRRRLVTRHPLQAFSPANFAKDGPLFSYARENFEGASARRGASRLASPFLRERLPEPPDELRTVDLARLASFLSHPARFFLTERLGVRLGTESYAVEETEPFEMAGLDRFLVAQDLTLDLLAGREVEAEKELLRARGLLPPAGPGELAFDRLRSDAQDLAERVRPLLRGDELEPLAIDLSFGDLRLVGSLDGVWPGGLVRFRPSKVRPGARLRAWVEHLALCCSQAGGYPEVSLLLGAEAEFLYRRADTCRELLGRLLELYWEGLRRPLPVFPATSLEYARRAEDFRTRDEALDAARKKWKGSEFDKAGEADGLDPYNELCFRGEDPLGEEFRELAREIFEPLLACEGKP